jgi:hypothetical protein
MRQPRTILLLVLVSAGLAVGACAHGQVSIGVGMGVPAPWGGSMMIGTAVPVGRW